MREIIFRAKRKDNGEWVEGFYIHCAVSGKDFIFSNGNEVNESQLISEEGYLRMFCFEVVTETLCQYTGLTDKNGSKIWENDIIQRTDLHISTEPSKGIIWYDKDNTAFLIKWLNPGIYSATYPWKDKIEVLGNVFDNADLLEG